MVGVRSIGFALNAAQRIVHKIRARSSAMLLMTDLQMITVRQCTDPDQQCIVLCGFISPSSQSGGYNFTMVNMHQSGH